MKLVSRTSSLLLLIILLSACANKVVEIKQGSEKISVADKSLVGKCKSKGKVTVSVTSKVGIYTRDIDTVEGNLTQLAKNSAVSEGADTIVRGASTNYGEREFELYQCR